MKNITIMYLTCILFSFFGVQNTTAQCSSTNNIVQSTDPNQFNNTFQELGNSFIATCSGTIEAVTMSFTVLDNPKSGRLRIYDVDDQNTVIGISGQVTISEGTNTIRFQLTTKATLINGEEYILR